MDVCTRAEDEESDPFEDLDGESDIQQLIERTMNTVECCARNEYVSGDDCLAVCVDLDDDKWEENFMADLAAKDNEVDGEHNGDEDESDQEDQPAAAPQLTSFQDAIASLEQVQHFLEFQGMMHEATILSRTVDDLARVSANSSRQTTLLDYFH
jgi:hypothetical protein